MTIEKVDLQPRNGLHMRAEKVSRSIGNGINVEADDLHIEAVNGRGVDFPRPKGTSGV